MLTIGDTLPSFSLQAVTSLTPGKEFETVTDRSYGGKWKVLFFWPMDFTFICPTEIAEFGRRHQDFLDRDAQVLGASTDTHFVHLAWRQSHPDLKSLPYPMLADTKRELSSALGILHKQDGVALRATFLVDPDGVIRWASVHDASTSRSNQPASQGSASAGAVRGSSQRSAVATRSSTSVATPSKFARKRSVKEADLGSSRQTAGR